MLIVNLASADIIFANGGVATGNEHFRIDANGCITVGNAALATTATNGDLYSGQAF